jgi:hypothetical protein
MRSSFAMWVPDFESAPIADKPACVDFARAFRSAASIACVQRAADVAGPRQTDVFENYRAI